MIEFILATTIIVGKTEIGPDTIQYDLLNEEGQIEHVIDTNPTLWLTLKPMNITTEQHSQLIELLEDTVSYYCDENRLSGEMVYTIIEAYSAAKVAQLRGEVQ